MIVGTMEVDIYIGWATSLKDKRRVVKGLCDRIKSRYDVAIAEVGNCDLWQRSTLGIACVSNEARVVDSVLSRVLRDIESDPKLEVTGVEKCVL
ncbi:MAG: DUF503 domain-containing protein [Bacillota bacterium]|jgi:uncharacterized protein YlxP (DUF503 family)|nr:DUF503 domain-containing protein [Bacillota bacterium]HOL01672.1 DUF503 domain-containing protein [Bacillota bacterium]